MLAPKEHAGKVLDGFRDKDTGEIVHMKPSCRDLHYERKMKRKDSHKATYSEIPITIN